MRRGALIAAAVLTAAAPLDAQRPIVVPSDSAVRAIIKERVDAKLAKGIVVGVLDPDGRRRVFTYGVSGTVRPLDASSVFEIASITKTFAGVLLAEMAARGEVRLEDPVARYLPTSVKVPSRNGRRITLVDLATHSSALPRELGSHWPNDLADPFADITPDLLYAFLSSHKLRRDPGAQFEYSNVGFMLLSDALARRAGAASYEALLRPRVLEPLGLGDTRVSLTPSMRDRLVLGHDQSGAVVPSWHMHGRLGGSGALLSTANDLLTWVAANLAADLDPARGPLATALRASHVRRRGGPPGQDIGLAWNRRALPAGDTIVSKNGSSGGYRAFVGYLPARRAGVVVLANSSISADDIAIHLLAPELPLAPPELPSWIGLEPVTLPSAVLDSYVGEYALSPGFHIVLRRMRDGLVLKPTGDPTGQPMRLVTAERLFAEREDEFFLKVVDARISFQRDGAGRVNALMLRQEGREQRAARVP
jgi:CubicO group peptidase (beta-lactamase class C family)